MDEQRQVPARTRAAIPALWIVAGALSVLAASLPWTSHGPLSSANLLDAARLVGQGTVAVVVPRSAAAVLVTPAVVGIALIGLGGLHGVLAVRIRAVVAVAGGLAACFLVMALTDGDLSRTGPGAFVALASSAIALVAVLGPRFRR